MRHRLHPREAALSQGGFTLLEMLVVLMTMSVLIAVSVPFFQSFRARGQDVSVQSSLRTALVLERAHWQEYGGYTTDVTELKPYDMTFSFGTLGDPVTEHMPIPFSDLTSAQQRVCLTALSSSGTWFTVLTDATTGTSYFGTGLPVACDTALTSGYSTSGW